MQKQMMKCADSRHLIHLAVGDDTLPEEESQLTAHLHSCSDCRAYHAGMVDAMHAIERVRHTDSGEEQTRSIWPAIADQLKARRPAHAAPQGRRFNGAVAALCACSLLLAFVTAVQHLPSNSPEAVSGYSPVSAMNVNHSGQGMTQQDFQRRLVQVVGPNGTPAWVDPVTRQVYVPNLMQSMDTGDDLNF